MEDRHVLISSLSSNIHYVHKDTIKIFPLHLFFYFLYFVKYAYLVILTNSFITLFHFDFLPLKLSGRNNVCSPVRRCLVATFKSCDNDFVINVK